MSEDPPDLAELLDKNAGYLKHLIKSKAGDLVLAKESVADLCQSISREVVEDQQNFDYRSDNEFKAWLKQIVASKIVDKHRYYTAQKRDVRQEHRSTGTTASGGNPRHEGLDSLTPSRNAMIEESRTNIAIAIEQLPEDYRVVLRLFYFEGLAHEEIAVQIGREPSATRKLLSRAKARLGILLAGMEDRQQSDVD